MSHIETVKTLFADLECVREACREFGAEFVSNKTSYAWFGVSVGDYPLPEGMTVDQLGKCAHVIRVPGVAYEIGLVAVTLPNGRPAYRLAYDFYGPGQGLQEKFCNRGADGKLTRGLEKLVDAYSTAWLVRKAKALGHKTRVYVGQDGKRKVAVTVGA